MARLGGVSRGDTDYDIIVTTTTDDDDWRALLLANLGDEFITDGRQFLVLFLLQTIKSSV